MFGSAGRWEMPFDKACARYQGDVVQIKDVDFEVEARLCRDMGSTGVQAVMMRDEGHTRRALGTVRVSV